MDSNNIEQLNQVQVTETPVQEALQPQPGMSVETKAPEQVFIEWGHLADVNCFCMMVTIPSSGNFRVNFNLAELRGMRDNIVSLIDAYTK